MTKRVRKPKTVDELQRIALRFRLLGDPTRLRILEEVCDRPRAVNEIVTAVGATQANVSKHLALMAAAGLLTRERRGQSVYYGMKDPLILKVCALMHAHIT
jgi:DNA-binding transcriptional ArsR family regulator